MVFFELVDNIFGSKHERCIILLDVTKDVYFTLDETGSLWISLILKNSFRYTNDTYTFGNECHNSFESINVNDVSRYIKYFIKQGIIKAADNFIRKNQLSVATNGGGLSQIEWHLFKKKSNEHPFHFKDFFSSIIILIKIHRIIKNYGLSSLLNYINSFSKSNSSFVRPMNQKMIDYLAYVVDKACLFTHKKTLCLPWAATLAVLMIKNGYKGRFVIGVQDNPFYAHAWIESNQKVVNDNPELMHKLSPIFSIDF